MTQPVDDGFYARADAHIQLSNQQISEAAGRGKVSASMMFATARFNTWVSACEYRSGEHMAQSKEQLIEYFLKQYRYMLEENMDDYIQDFDKYMHGGE